MNIRTIMIFQEFENIDIINDIRKKYDPLVHLVLPHITLVFHFNSEITNEELSLHLKECLSDIHPFKIELEGFSKQKNKYCKDFVLNFKLRLDNKNRNSKMRCCIDRIWK